MSSPLTPRLLRQIRGQFKLDWHGHHGAPHWARVRHHGLYVGRQVGADLRVVELFAFLHDSRRENEYEDPAHGRRASDYAGWLRGEGFFELDDPAFDLLTAACDGHSEGHRQAPVTVQACWDADRLDLGRVGIRPDSRRLCTPVAQTAAYIERAWQWGLQHADRLSRSRGRRGWYSDEDGMTQLGEF